MQNKHQNTFDSIKQPFSRLPQIERDVSDAQTQLDINKFGLVLYAFFSKEQFYHLPKK